MRRPAALHCLIMASGLMIGSKAVSLEPSSQQSPTPRLVGISSEILPLVHEAEQSFAKGDLGKADALYASALKSAPNDPSLLVSAAAVKTKLGRLGDSKFLLRKALSLNLENSKAWQLLGMNALEEKKDDEAFANLVQATLYNDSNPRAHNYLGMAAGRKGWMEVSEQELRRAVELDPNYADANYNLAVLYLGRTPPLVELARRHYQRALDLGTQHDPVIEKLISKAVATQLPDSPRSPIP